MAETHDIGSYFWCLIKLEPKTAIIHRAQTVEIEPPFRVSESILLRIWKWGFVFGKWGRRLDEDQALLLALQAEELDWDDLEDEVKCNIRWNHKIPIRRTDDS